MTPTRNEEDKGERDSDDEHNTGGVELEDPAPNQENQDKRSRENKEGDPIRPTYKQSRQWGPSLKQQTAKQSKRETENDEGPRVSETEVEEEIRPNAHATAPPQDQDPRELGDLD